MVSTRLQSNSNSSCGDGSMLPSTSDPTSAKLPVYDLTSTKLLAQDPSYSKFLCSTGCVTRSGANTHPTTVCHSKDASPLKSAMNLMDLPIEIIQKIASYCGYKTVANLRMVSKFDSCVELCFWP